MELRIIICNRRKELNINQETLARFIQRRPSTISQFESGKSSLGSKDIDKILSILRLEVVRQEHLEILKKKNKDIDDIKTFK